MEKDPMNAGEFPSENAATVPPTDTAGAPTNTPSTTTADAGTAVPPAGDAARKVAAKLHAPPEATPQSQQTAPLNIDDLSEEDIRRLKARFAATPDRIRPEKKFISVRLRKIDGKIVTNFSNAYKALIDDAENNRKVERHMIKIQFFGEKEQVPMLYSEFINAEQIACQVVSQRQEVEEQYEGQVISRQTGRLTDMIRRITHKWYSVKLPSGEVLEIDGRIING